MQQVRVCRTVRTAALAAAPREEPRRRHAQKQPAPVQPHSPPARLPSKPNQTKPNQTPRSVLCSSSPSATFWGATSWRSSPLRGRGTSATGGSARRWPCGCSRCGGGGFGARVGASDGVRGARREVCRTVGRGARYRERQHPLPPDLTTSTLPDCPPETKSHRSWSRLASRTSP
jgi:hypothetical protein